MASKTVTEEIQGTLTDEKGNTHSALFRAKVKELYTNEKAAPVRRAIADIDFSPRQNAAVPEGKYTLTLSFDGQTERQKVRVENGTLLGGWS